MIKLGVLVSSRGSNLQAITDAIERGEVDAKVAIVLSNRPEAYALTRAANHNIPARVVREEDFPSRLEHNRYMVGVLEEHRVDLVVLAGYDRILYPEFVRAFPMRIINIHPSLLPSFGGGLDAQEDALRYGVKVTGCTVHFVTEDVDGGPIILQKPVAITDDDTVESLSLRILDQEHRILPRAIQLFARGSLRVEGRRVFGSDQ
ncbi:MAG: phosphoribosylglycinamide formyltransferase [Dehalococcoidia bacterium]|nr:phosphoribosylglycinamide formyltransferase [Dehalococcoidia bacterium]